MNPNHALLPEWMFRWVQRPTAAPMSTLMTSRIEVRPPEPWPSSLSWRGRLQRWLNQGAPWVAEPDKPVNRLARVKDEFLHDLQDLDSRAATDLAVRVARARSLREMWHLRSPLYGVVATALSQSEAERRLARLNRHFPTHAPRSAVGSVPAEH